MLLDGGLAKAWRAAGLTGPRAHLVVQDGLVDAPLFGLGAGTFDLAVGNPPYGFAVPRPEGRGGIEERTTYHDPCNIARSGWILEEPRDILNAICKDFVDMVPNRERNYCCGGGGGSVSIDEMREFRTGLAGRTKAEQIRRTGAKYLVAPCANCKKQLREVCEDNGLDEVEVVGLHDLVLKVLEF